MFLATPRDIFCLSRVPAERESARANMYLLVIVARYRDITSTAKRATAKERAR